MRRESLTYIKTPQQLQEAVDELAKEKELAIDLECENNLHHYGMYISLVQIATRSKQYVADIIALGTLGGLKDILEDPAVAVVFHDVSFDLRILNHQFDCHPRNVYDTKVAATFLDKEQGLAQLLEEYFAVKKQKKFQMADWTRRPIKRDMLEYAADDTTKLLALHDRLVEEMEARGYLQWYEAECDYIEEVAWEQKVPSFDSLKGFSKLTDQQKTIVEALFSLRERYAKTTDKPPHYIFSNRRIIDFAKQPPKHEGVWRSMKGVHPIVKRKAEELQAAVESAKAAPKKYPSERMKRYNMEQRNHFSQLNSAREAAAKKTGLVAHLILSKDQMKDIVLTKSYASLRPWQKEVLGL